MEKVTIIDVHGSPLCLVSIQWLLHW